ncbi:MAG: hypothetical protein ACM3TN_14230 [Alphaproteobacteria bacterium]
MTVLKVHRARGFSSVCNHVSSFGEHHQKSPTSLMSMLGPKGKLQDRDFFESVD